MHTKKTKPCVPNYSRVPKDTGDYVHAREFRNKGNIGGSRVEVTRVAASPSPHPTDKLGKRKRDIYVREMNDSDSEGEGVRI